MGRHARPELLDFHAVGLLCWVRSMHDDADTGENCCGVYACDHQVSGFLDTLVIMHRRLPALVCIVDENRQSSRFFQ
jgi:hypothetical protein